MVYPPGEQNHPSAEQAGDKTMAKFTSKLPFTVAESLKIKPPEPSVLVKARVHESRAEKLRQQQQDAKREAEDGEAVEGPRPHLEFLERWKALETALTPIETKARKEYIAKLGHEPKPHEVIGHLIGSLPRPRMDAIFKDPRLVELNVALGHRPLQKIVTDNELLQDLGINWRTFVDAKRDLKFQLGWQSYKSAQALAVYLTVIRAAVDPKVRKTANFVRDAEVLDLAKGLLREVMTHIIEELQMAHDSFFAVGDRAAVGEQFRLDKAKKSGRPTPDANAPKGRPQIRAEDKSASRPKPGATKA